MDAFRAERTVKVVSLELIKRIQKKWVLLELIELGKWVHSEKVGAFRANRTGKMGAFGKSGCF